MGRKSSKVLKESTLKKGTKKIQGTLFISFQSIINGQPYGVLKGILPKLNTLDEESRNNITYIVSRSDAYRGDLNVEDIGKLYLFIIRVINLLNRLSKSFFSDYIRYFQERIFDLFLSCKLKNPHTIVSTAYLLRTQKKNRELGGKNIFLAGNPDDYEIHTLLLDEQAKYGIRFKDAYTNRTRIKSISKSIIGYDHIIVFNALSYRSYNKRVSKEKLSLIQSHLLPLQKSFPEISFEKQNSLSFCFIAHPTWLKGLPYLLEAWSKIQKNDVILRVGGRIDKYLQVFIDQNYPNLKNVEYLGWVSDLNDFLRSSHICIVPSLLDAGPATIGEALYCGLPVITTDGCGDQTLINDGENGFIVPAKDADAIAEKIKWFISNQIYIPIMSEKARKTMDDLKEKNLNKTVAEMIIKTALKVSSQ